MLSRRLSLLTCALATCACGLVEFPEPTRASLIPVAGTGGSTSAGGTSAAGGSTDPALSCGHDEFGPFPATGYLDRFDRADGPLGANWMVSDSSTLYTLLDGALSGPSAPAALGGQYTTNAYWKSELGTGAEEVYATFVSFDPALYLMSLVMRAQLLNDGCDNLQVSLSNEGQTVSVRYCASLTTALVSTEETPLQAPFVLGARAFDDGCVEIYVDGVRRFKANAASYPYAASPGYIGVTAIPAADGGASTIIPRWDDFGGGALP